MDLLLRMQKLMVRDAVGDAQGLVVTRVNMIVFENLLLLQSKNRWWIKLGFAGGGTAIGLLVLTRHFVGTIKYVMPLVGAACKFYTLSKD